MFQEAKENNTAPQYIQIGEIPDFGNRLGKHERIEILNDIGFEIPDTLVLGKECSPSQLDKAHSWCQDKLDNGKEIMIRMDNRGDYLGRNMPYIFAKENSKYKNGKSLVDSILPSINTLDVLIFQSMEKNNINKQILSVNYQWEKKFLGYEIRFEAAPDIGTMINRLSLPIFKMDNNGEIKTTESEYLKDMILYRIGRLELQDTVKLPSIENLEIDFSRKYSSVISLGFDSIKNYPEKYPGPAFWYENFLSNDCHKTIFPLSLEKPVYKEFDRVRRKAVSNKLPYENGFIKMSFLLNEKKEIYPVYLDIF